MGLTPAAAAATCALLRNPPALLVAPLALALAPEAPECGVVVRWWRVIGVSSTSSDKSDEPAPPPPPPPGVVPEQRTPLARDGWLAGVIMLFSSSLLSPWRNERRTLPLSRSSNFALMEKEMVGC